MSITSPAESTEVVKKMTTRTTARICMAVVSGKFSRKVNSATATSPCSTTGSTSSPGLSCSMAKEDQPNTPNHRMENITGAASTPPTNCRIVRPLEILAMKMPVNGDQEMVHAQ